MDEELLYRRRILLLYGVAIAMNAWFAWELLKENQQGRAVIEKIKNKFLLPTPGHLYNKVTGKSIVEEAEEILRGKNA